MAAARARQGSPRPAPRPMARPRAVAGGRMHGIRWDRVSRVALLGVLVGVALLYIGPAASYVSTWRKARHERAVVAELKRENRLLRARRVAATHPGVLEREARQLGMTRPGERVYVLRGLPKSP